MEEKKSKAEETGETDAGPRIMRQLLKTPMFKDLATLAIHDWAPETPRELAKTLIWEDSAFSFGLLRGLPRKINFLIVFLDELGMQLQNIPPDLLHQFITEMAVNIDKEAIKALPGAYTPVLDALIWEDPERRRHIREGAVESLNALMRMLAGFLSAANMRLDGTGESSMEDLYPDPQALGELITFLFRWMGTAAGKDEETIRARREKKIRILQETMQATDFGVIRDALTRRAETFYPVTKSIIGTMVTDPIIFANLLNILPPLLNNLLKGISHGVAEIDFPPEILASAIFNFMDSLEAEEIGKLINGLCRFICHVHEGSLVLGGDEPRFRPVFQNLMERVIIGIDETMAADALLALFEDVEVIIPVVADVILERPELLQKGAPVLISGFNALMRGFSYLVTKLNRLPQESYQQLNLEWMEKADFKEAGVLITALVRLLNQVLSPHPDLIEKTLSSVYRAVDKKELGTLIQTLVTQGISFFKNESLWELLPPDEAGKMFNSMLMAYNHNLGMFTEKSRESLSIFMAQIDQHEVSNAILNTSNRISDALSANPQLAQSVMKSIYAVVRGVLKGAYRNKNKGKSRERGRR